MCIRDRQSIYRFRGAEVEVFRRQERKVGSSAAPEATACLLYTSQVSAKPKGWIPGTRNVAIAMAIEVKSQLSIKRMA